MGVIHFPRLTEVEILPPPVMFRVKTQNRFLSQLEDGKLHKQAEYATVTIDESTGTVSCQSGHGDFSFTWPPSGRSEDIFTFLASLNFDYFMNKAAKQPWQVIDLERTLEYHRDEIRKERRGRRTITDLDSETANDLWDALDGIEADYPQTDAAFLQSWHNRPQLSEFFIDYSPALFYRTAPNAQTFWDDLWRPLIESPQFQVHLKKRQCA